MVWVLSATHRTFAWRLLCSAAPAPSIPHALLAHPPMLMVPGLEPRYPRDRWCCMHHQQQVYFAVLFYIGRREPVAEQPPLRPTQPPSTSASHSSTSPRVRHDKEDQSAQALAARQQTSAEGFMISQALAALVTWLSFLLASKISAFDAGNANPEQDTEHDNPQAPPP